MKYYCLGVKGTGMSTLAQILFDLGCDVVGYDDSVEYKFTEDGLKERGIKVYHEETDIEKDRIVTYSVALPEDHSEIVRMKKNGNVIKKYNEIVGEITKEFNSICVSGTHGKTTTSSIVRHILENTIGCNYFIGAGDGLVDKNIETLVIESDEFNKHFLAYHPKTAIVTNIEEEHMECFKDLDDIIASFKTFASRAEVVVCCGDNENVRKMELNNAIYYGFNSDNQYVIKNNKTSDIGEEFDLYKDGEFVYHFETNLYGDAMILDSVAAIITCNLYGVSNDLINKLLKTFKNAKRRLEEVKVNDIYVVDDYAHHPTEIRETIKALRKKYKDKYLTVIFRPNTYSRTRDFKDDFVSALSLADKVYVTEVLSNREDSRDYPGVGSFMIVRGIDNGEILDVGDIKNIEIPNDSVVCFMSCAYIGDLKEELMKKLEN